MDFLLVIPAFEESRRLPAFLESLAPALQDRAYSTSILVVDDGSSETERAALLQKLQPLRERYPILAEPLLLPQNVGKGGAIMAGWNGVTTARWLAFVDADGAISAQEVCRVFDRLAADEDERKSVFAARIRMLGRSVQRSTARHLSGRIFASLVGNVIDPRVYDTQCGFKVVASVAWRTIGCLLAEKRFAFDVELAAALLFFEFPVEEIPIDWADQPGSKVSFLRDATRMLLSVFRIHSHRAKWSSALEGERRVTTDPLPADRRVH